jgi:hypothetical protein
LSAALGGAVFGEEADSVGTIPGLPTKRMVIAAYKRNLDTRCIWICSAGYSFDLPQVRNIAPLVVSHEPSLLGGIDHTKNIITM